MIQNYPTEDEIEYTTLKEKFYKGNHNSYIDLGDMFPIFENEVYCNIQTHHELSYNNKNYIRVFFGGTYDFKEFMEKVGIIESDYPGIYEYTNYYEHKCYSNDTDVNEIGDVQCIY